MTRSYEMKRRAKAQLRTRQKIVDATIDLHQTKGIAATSFADVAERAGVGKVTVYRHFADEDALAAACSGQYFERHPLPDVEAWRKIADPAERLRQGLCETYRYHRETEEMMARVLPEVRDHPVVEPYHAHWRRAVRILAEPWRARGVEATMLHAGLALAVAFDTWRLLVRGQRLTDRQAIRLMTRLVETRAGEASVSLASAGAPDGPNRP